MTWHIYLAAMINARNICLTRDNSLDWVDDHREAGGTCIAKCSSKPWFTLQPQQWSRPVINGLLVAE